jgi:hypothetical protein
MKVITIQNAERTKKAEITRTKLSDGYNYYITLYTFNSSFNSYFINSNFTQTESILSKIKAVEVAENLIN